MVEGKDYCFSFNLLRLSSCGFTKTKTSKASFSRLNQQTRQHTDLKEVLLLIILILTCFNLSNTYLRFKNYHITRTFLLPAATAFYWKINALPAGNRPEIMVGTFSCEETSWKTLRFTLAKFFFLAKKFSIASWSLPKRFNFRPCFAGQFCLAAFSWY